METNLKRIVLCMILFVRLCKKAKTVMTKNKSVDARVKIDYRDRA